MRLHRLLQHRAPTRSSAAATNSTPAATPPPPASYASAHGASSLRSGVHDLSWHAGHVWLDQVVRLMRRVDHMARMRLHRVLPRHLPAKPTTSIPTRTTSQPTTSDSSIITTAHLAS